MNWYNKFIRFAAWRNAVSMLSKDISYFVFHNYFTTTNVPKQIIVDHNQFPLLVNYSIRTIIINVVNMNTESILTAGEHLENLQAIRITLYFNTDNYSQNLFNTMRQRLNYIIRHELEHPNMLLVDHSIPSSSLDTEEIKHLNVIQLINYRRSHLLNKGEMNSYIREIMLRVKDEQIHAEEMVGWLVDNELINGISQENVVQYGAEISKISAEIKREYMSELNKIYPNRGTWKS